MDRGEFCNGCGRPRAQGTHAACDRRLGLEPARFCGACGFRLDVQIYPDRVESACRECRRRARRAPGAPCLTVGEDPPAIPE